MEADPVPPDQSDQLIRMGPIAFNERLIVVLEGKYVAGRVFRDQVQRLEIQWRSSFKHPFLGIVIGAGCCFPLGELIAGDPLELGGLFSMNVRTLAGSLFLFLCGIYLLFGAIFRRQVPFLVAQTTTGEYAFRLRETITPEIEQFVTKLNP